MHAWCALIRILAHYLWRRLDYLQMACVTHSSLMSDFRSCIFDGCISVPKIALLATYVSRLLCESVTCTRLLLHLQCKPKWAHNHNAHFCAVHSLWSMACYTFFVGHTANFVIKMIQVGTKISSWIQKYVDSSGTFVFKIGQKVKE